MPDEPSQTPETPKVEILGNDPAARNPDGTIKDPAAPTTTPTESSITSKTSTESPPKSDTPEPTKASGAPEAYAEFKAPEGYEVDKKSLEAALPVFKELNLSQDQAQKLVDFYATVSKEAAEAPMKVYADMRQDWRKEIINSDLGNGTDDLKPDVKQAVGDAINAMPNAAKFKEVLDISGLGDNPEFIRGFYTVAKQRAEGTPVKGGQPSPLGQTDRARPRSAAQALYPNLPSAS